MVRNDRNNYMNECHHGQSPPKTIRSFIHFNRRIDMWIWFSPLQSDERLFGRIIQDTWISWLPGLRGFESSNCHSVLVSLLIVFCTLHYPLDRVNQYTDDHMCQKEMRVNTMEPQWIELNLDGEREGDNDQPVDFSIVNWFNWMYWCWCWSEVEDAMSELILRGFGDLNSCGEVDHILDISCFHRWQRPNSFEIKCKVTRSFNKHWLRQEMWVVVRCVSSIRNLNQSVADIGMFWTRKVVSTQDVKC
jgi:hypothetical protein